MVASTATATAPAKKRSKSKGKSQVKSQSQSESQLTLIRSLESKVKASKKNANCIVEILELCECESVESAESVQVSITAIHAMQRIFHNYIANDVFLVGGEKDSVSSNSEDNNGKKIKGDNNDNNNSNNNNNNNNNEDADPKAAFRNWLKDMYKDYLRTVLSRLETTRDEETQVAIVNVLMQFVEIEARKLVFHDQPHTFPNTLLYRTLKAMVNTRVYSEAMVEEFVTKYLLQYDDVRYYTYKNLT